MAILGYPGLTLKHPNHQGQMCVNRRKRRVLCRMILHYLSPFLVVRVLPSTLLPGFIGPESSVLPVNLPPFAPFPLRVLLIGPVL